MRRRLPMFVSLGLVVSVAALLSSGAEAGEENDRYRFHVSVNMVSLSVTALDQKSRLVTGLNQEDFTIYEDGVEQQLEAFSRENLPLRMAILLDTSASMRPRLPMAQEAAIRFVRSLKAEDRVSVVQFNDRVRTLRDFTSDFDEVVNAIESTTTRGSTSLYNALYIALRSLPQRREGVERQAIVLLSDGADNRSLVSFETVRDLARRTDVAIFGIGLLGLEADSRAERNATVKYELEKLANDTGGAAFLPERIEDLVGVYDRIAAELKSQYNLGYVSSHNASAGAWRRIQVLCGQPGVRARTRSGYYEPQPASSTRRSRP